VQASRLSVIAALAAGLVLSACATSAPPTNALQGTYTGGNSAGSGLAAVGQRDLTPQEKKVIIDAVAPSLRNPNAAKYKWAKFPDIVTEDSVNYCATVDAGSPFAAYNGRQAYIVEAHVVGGRVTSAVMGLIAGGKDFQIVSGMCAKYGLNPNSAT
jgi:hypothetical protein